MYILYAIKFLFTSVIYKQSKKNQILKILIPSLKCLIELQTIISCYVIKITVT